MHEHEERLMKYVDEVINRGDFSRFEDFVGPDIMDHDPNTALFEDSGIIPGEDTREKAKRHIMDLRRAFPDLCYTLYDLRLEGDIVHYRWRASGTHRGDYVGLAASNRFVSIEGKGSVRIDCGQIVETWDEWDAAELVRQLKSRETPDHVI